MKKHYSPLFQEIEFFLNVNSPQSHKITQK